MSLRPMRAGVGLAILAMLGMTQLATAQELRLQKALSLELATGMAQGAMAYCKDHGWTVSVSVVDRAGQLVTMLRADGASATTFDASRRKAFTAASLRNGTTATLHMVQKTPDLAYLPMIDGFLLLGGGVPIRVGDEVIGAVGVSGAPGGQLDDQCAEAGIARASEHLK